MKICENIIIVCYVVLNAILNGVISYFILLHHMVLYQTRLYYIVLHRILNIEYYKKTYILYKLYIYIYLYILYLYILTINSLYILKIKKQIKIYMLYRLYVYILCIVFVYTIFKFIASKLYIYMYI